MTTTNGPTDPARRAMLATLAAAPLLASVGACAAEPQADGAGANTAGVAPRATDRRRLGSLEVSAIGMGVQNMSRTFQGTIPQRPEMIRIIRAAHEAGVAFFDTAEVYGPHECERILGEASQSFRNDIVIASKFGFNVDLQTGTPGPGLISRPAHIKEVVEGSLRRLRTDRIDLLYQHRVDPTVPIEDVAGAVRDLKTEGKILNWGLSEMGLGTLRRAHAELPVTAVQSEYSMLWRGPEQSVIPTCRELGIGFVPFAPLGYGFLTGAIDAQTRFAPTDYRAGTPRMSAENLPNNMALVALVKSWAERKSAAPGQIALAWLMAQAPWIVPIPGTTQMPHMRENVGATAVRFSPEELAELNRAVRAIQIRGARMSPMVQAWSDVEAPARRS